MTDAGKMNTEEMLQQVETAISTVMIGGQSYQIGSRKLTRADLSLLWKMKKELQAEVNAANSSNLLDDTYVAFFEGR